MKIREFLTLQLGISMVAAVKDCLQMAATYISPPCCPSRGRKWSVGGIVNNGNSCFANVIFQELANFPEIYKQSFFQNSVIKIIDTIRSGSLTRISGIPSGQGSLFQFYQTILGEHSYPIVHIDEDPASLPEKIYEVDKRLKEIDIPIGSLCRITLPLHHQYKFSDVVKTDTHTFALRQVHYSPKKDHIATARKMGDVWLHIDDTMVSPGSRPLEDQAVVLIYEPVASARPPLRTEEVSEMAHTVSRVMKRVELYQGLEFTKKKFTLKEFQMLEDLAKVHEMQELIHSDHTILKTARAAHEVLERIKAKEPSDFKGDLIVYSMKEAEEYGGWKLPRILKWISRIFYRSEVIHMGVLVSNNEGRFISDLTMQHRLKKWNLGDHIYDRYSIRWEKLVREGISPDEMKLLFQQELVKLHANRSNFSSVKNTLLHIFKRNFLPRILWTNEEPSLKGEMLCSTFAERLLVTTLSKVEARVGKSCFNIPKSSNSAHNDLPHQMMQTWGHILEKVPPSQFLRAVLIQ
jgi:hypothetical protein